MEKIQAAIAKARAARGRKARAPQPAGAGTDAAGGGSGAEAAPLLLVPAARVGEAAPPSPAPADTVAPVAPVAPPPADADAAGASPRSEPPAPAAPTAGKAAPAAAPAPLSPAAGVEAAWLALPNFTPDPRHLQHSRIMAAEAGPEALSFDVIRTRVLQQMRANNWSRLAITSPGTGCGKSMLTLNLAFSLARQPEQRTILIETDLRRPNLSRYLGLKAQHDVSRVLEGRAPFPDHAVRIGTNLAIATQSHSVRAPAELLQGAAVTEALAGIARDYRPTVMLFDMPPMQAGDDAMAFVGAVDAVLIVAAAEMTTIKQIDLCERELATQCNVMGVVLNKCRYLDPAHYDYGY